MNQLKQKRKDLQLTQLQAANACGVSLRTYQTYEETDKTNETSLELIKILEEIKENQFKHIVSVRYIRITCRLLFKEKYPEIKCAYLYGSYARGEATGKSDIDILVVLDKPMGMRFYRIASDLEDRLFKTVDLQSYEQLLSNVSMLKDVLVEGIRIYG